MNNPLSEADIIQIIVPSTLEQWNAYYRLRWLILRQPWDMPEGSEKDEHENNAHHLAAIQTLSDQMVGCARFHPLAKDLAQIRFMAIATPFQRKGIGAKLILHLELQAKQMGIKTLILNARDTAVSFYQSHGYQTIHPLEPFLGIAHYRMQKNLIGHLTME